MTLHDRFISFCKQYPGSEAVDDVVAGLDIPVGTKIADFFFEGRSIVCEVKTLTSETADRLAAYMKDCGIDPAALAAGRNDVVQLFLALPGGEAKLKKAISIATRPVAEGLDHAEKQIRSSKVFFNLPDADGLLVLLNDQVQLASPPVVRARLGQRIAQNAPDGSPYHVNINHVLFVCEKWVMAGNDKPMNLSLGNPRAPERNGVAAFAETFMRTWGSLNGQPMEMANAEQVRVLNDSRLVVNVEDAETES